MISSLIYRFPVINSALIITLATLLQQLLSVFVLPPPFLLYYPSIIVTSIYGHGFLGIILSIFAVDFFFMGPGKLFDYHWPDDALLMSIFILFSVMIRALTHKLSMSNLRAQELIKNLEREKILREQFVSSLTHDLRNPITAAKLSAENGIRHPDKADMQLLLTRITNSLNRADRMIRDMLDANTIKAGEKLVLPKEHMELSSLCQVVIEDKTLQHGERFRLKTSDEIRGVWNPEGLRRILENLIDNAVKYGSDKDPITVQCLREPGAAKLSVHNHGQPIPPEEQTKIFDSFERTMEAKASGKQGWGLGLTLVKGITESHGGSVVVKSDQQGTLFTVTLPFDARDHE